MKYFSVFFSFLFLGFLSLSIKAQWILQHAPGLPNSSQPQVIFSPVNDNVCWGIIHTNPQFLRTTNGGDTWSVSTVAIATGLRCTGITTVTVDVNTAWIAMNDPTNLTSGGIFKTTDGGNTWTQQIAFQGSGGHPNVIHFFDADNGLCVGNPRNSEFEIYTTTNGGNNWIQVPGTNIPNPLSGELGIEHTIVNSAGNSFWFQTYSNRLFRTTDHGYTWTVADSVTGGPSQLGFGFAFKDDLNGFACDYYPDIAFTNTTDGGESWTPNDPFPSGLSQISPLLIIYVTGSIGSYVITSPNYLGGNPMLPGSAYSTDNGLTWSQVSTFPLGPAAFSDCNTGWAGGVNDEIWKWGSDTLLCPTVSVEQENNSTIPDGFVLEQNYPNPFNPSTTIRYSIPTSEFVALKVYDVLGNEVANLVNEEKPIGNYEVSFNAAKLSSGVYLYRLHAGSFVQTKKLILMK